MPVSPLNIVKPYLSNDEPFGPIDSGDIDSADVDALKYLFEQHNSIYNKLRNRPSIIIGRRGSGKTSYLRSVFFGTYYQHFIEMRTAPVLSQMTKVIQRMSKDSYFPEMVSDLWEMVIWIGVFSEIRKKELLPSDDLYVVKAYLDRLKINYSDRVDGVISDLAKTLDDVMDKNPSRGASEIINELDRSKFDYVRSVVLKGFEKSGKRFVVLLDSLDDFQLDIDSVSQSLQGLLKLVGSMNKPRDIVDIRFCLPAEVYHRFLKVSSNPNKDFRRALKLQWTAAELILIGAQRLNFYLAIYYQEFLKEQYPLDVAKRTDALKLFQAVLPERITNQAGVQEDTVSYILRHTQLLPRHFLMLLNSIFKRSSSTQSLSPFPVSQERIINGIRQVEEFIVGEIFVAFKLIYPTAEATCRRCLPELGHKFTMGDLHRVFTRHGKAVFGSDSLFEFQRMLLEIGAIGRVIPGKEKDVYIKGNFEYTVSHQLNLSQEDELCVHPLFSGIFHANSGGEKPVYPYGSTLDDEDYRENED
ncbi:MAG: hypothetical protein U0Z26_06775 [Anaerolineales bacterium]